MPLPKFVVKFSGGNLLLGNQIRISDFAQKEVPNSKENRYWKSDQFLFEIELQHTQHTQIYNCK